MMYRMRHRKLRAANRRGASTVEFAMVFPIILSFGFGMIAMSHAYVLRDVAQHAAYEGARRAVVLDATTEDAIASVDEFLQVMRVQGANVEAEINSVSAMSSEVTVRVDIPMSENAWAGGSFLPDVWTVSGEVTLTKTGE